MLDDYYNDRINRFAYQYINPTNRKLINCYKCGNNTPAFNCSYIRISVYEQQCYLDEASRDFCCLCFGYTDLYDDWYIDKDRLWDILKISKN